MLTKAEKGYLALTLFFLATGGGIKAWRHGHAKIGPFPDPVAAASAFPGGSDSARADASASGSGPVNDSSTLAGADSLAGESAQPASPSGSDPAGTTRFRHQPGSREGKAAGKSAFAGKVNLNRAAAAELTQVKGIGAKTAEVIVAYRQAHGPFRDLRDLLQVKGIGEKKLEKLIPYLIL